MSAGLDGVLGRPKAEWTPSRDAYLARFSDSDRSLNRKRERFKVFEIESRSNWD